MRRQSLFIDVALYGGSALFALGTLWWSTLPTHSFWGGIAIGGYLPAMLVTVLLLNRYAVLSVTRLWVAIGTAIAVTVVPLLAASWQRAQGIADRSQEEVQVIENAGARLLETGTPYLSRSEISELGDKLYGYTPYQPGMSIFGIPKAIIGDYWFTDARVFFAIVTFAAMWITCKILLQAGATTGLQTRAIQAVSVFPIGAMTLATGGDDVPVLALCLLSITAVASKRYTVAGVAIGCAAALKLFAWPVLVVLLFLIWQQRKLVRFAPTAVVIPLAVLIPSIIIDAPAFVANVIDFPIGNGIIDSPAASPLPGYLIATHIPNGNIIALVLLGIVAVGIGSYLVKYPPVDASQAAAICAIGILVAMLLMPTSRFGYLLYPVGYATWWWILSATHRPAKPLVPAMTGDRKGLFSSGY